MSIQKIKDIIESRRSDTAIYAVQCLLISIQLKSVQMFGLAYIWQMQAAFFAAMSFGFAVVESRIDAHFQK